jgi:hypothetical protein
LKDAKGEATGKTILRVNGRRVQSMSRKDVMEATPDMSASERNEALNLDAISKAMVVAFQNLKENPSGEGRGKAKA